MSWPSETSKCLSPEDIARILVDENEVSEKEINEALSKQQKDKSLGEILVSEGYIASEDLSRILSRHINMQYVVLSEEEVDPELIGMVGEEILVECGAIPLRIEDGKLVVAMRDPANAKARSCVVESAGHAIVPVAAAEDAISSIRERLLNNGKNEEDPDADSNGKGKKQPSPPTVGTKSPGRGGGRIGEILVEQGKLSPEQLQQAVDIRKDDPRNLGEILISLGLILPGDLAQALALRLRLDYVVLTELTEDETDSEAINLMDERNCRKYRALPLRSEDDRLVVAMSDPNDLYALEDLRIIANKPITPVVVSGEDLNGALDHLFGTDEEYQEEFPAEPDEMYSEIESAAVSVDSEDAPYAEDAAVVQEDETEERGASREDPVYEPDAAEAETLEAPPREPAETAETPEETFEDGANGHVKQPESQQSPKPRRSRTLAGSGRIGEILLSEGRITQEQLQQALSIKENDTRPIGEILVSLGYVVEQDLAEALARRLRLEYIELTESDVDRGLLTIVDQKVLRRHQAVPMRIQDGQLVVAMFDPKNIYALEDLRMISGYPITPAVATKSDIQRVQNKLFALGKDVSDFLQESAEGSFEGDEGEVDIGAEAGADEAPIIRLVSSILQQAVGEGASDIHIEPQAQEVNVRFRVDGVLKEAMSVPNKLQSGIVARLKVIASLNIAERRVPQDGRFSVRVGGSKVDLRVATLPTAYGEKIVLRLLDTSNVEADLKKLGFSDEVFRKYEDVFTRPYGAILVTGPTGSGKSTTLYATLNELNSPERNIITVEDPVEYRVAGLNQIQVNPRAGLTFASGLRSILRSDPDVIMIGEIRDAETAKISVESALTGHLVLATLHTNDAPGALTRLTEMGVEPFLTSSAVDCVIAQRLGRRLCGRCKQPNEIEREVLEEMDFPFHLVDESQMEFYKAVGCDRCGGTGYRGRIGFYEMMVVNDELKEMVLRRVSSNEIARAAQSAGMLSLREDGLIKVSQGLTTVEEVLRTVV